MRDSAVRIHEIRVKAEDEIERLLLQHVEAGGTTLDRGELRHQMDLAIAATIVENKIKARGEAEQKPDAKMADRG